MSDKQCKKCGQSDFGQTGEYPCSECKLPTTWDGCDKGACADCKERSADCSGALLETRLTSILNEIDSVTNRLDRPEKRLDRAESVTDLHTVLGV